MKEEKFCSLETSHIRQFAITTCGYQHRTEELRIKEVNAYDVLNSAAISNCICVYSVLSSFPPDNGSLFICFSTPFPGDYLSNKAQMD